MCGNNYFDNDGNNIGTDWYACENPELNLTFGGNVGLRFVIQDHHAIEAIVQPYYDIFYGNLQVLGLARYVYTF